MAKKLNKNMVIGLSLLCFVAMIGLSVVMIWMLQKRDPRHYADRAEEYRRRAEWDQARVFYNKAWLISSDVQYLIKRGEMFLNLGVAPKALASWQEAISADPESREAHVQYVQLMLKLCRLYGGVNYWLSLQEASEGMLETVPDDAFARHAHGLALFNLRSQQESYINDGMAEIEKAIEFDPTAVDYPIDLAECYRMRAALSRRDNDPAAAASWQQQRRELLEGLLERFSTPGPEASKLRIEYAGYLSEQEDYDAAERYYEEAVTLAGDDVETAARARRFHGAALMRRWLTARQAGAAPEVVDPLFAQTRELFETCIETTPEAYEAYSLLAQLYRITGQFEEARRVCDVRLARGLSRLGIEAALNRYNTVSLMLAACDACVLQAERSEDETQRAQLLANAQQYIDDARKELPDIPDVLFKAGTVKWALGEDREALELLRQADEGYRTLGRVNWMHKVALARAHLRLNEPGSALKLMAELETSARQSRPTDVLFWTVYAQALSNTNNHERAATIADYVLKLDPENVGARNIKVLSYYRQGRDREADAVANTEGSERMRLRLEIEQALNAEDKERALELLAQVLRDDAADIQFVSATVQILLTLNRVDEAREVVERAQALKPEDRQLKSLAILAHGDLGDDERLQAMLDLAQEEEDAFKQAWQKSNICYGAKKMEDALEWVNRAEQHLINQDTPAARTATSAQHRVLLTRKMLIAALLDNENERKATVESATQHDVDGAQGASFLGQYHMFREEPEQAIQAFNLAVERQPTDARSLTYLGKCYESVKRTDDARACYERALEVNPNEGLAWKGLAVLAAESKDSTEYQRCLKEAKKLLPRDPWILEEIGADNDRKDPVQALTRRARQLQQQEEELAQAAQEDAARNLPAGEHSDRWRRAERQLTENLGRIADLHESSRNYDKADQVYARLREMHPDDTQLVMTVSSYYVRTGRAHKSLALVRQNIEAQKTPEQRAKAHIPMAVHYMNEGNMAMVEATLLAAADEAETFEVCRSLADVYFRANAPGKALLWFDKAVEQAKQINSPRLLETISARIGCILHRNLNDVGLARQRVGEFLAEYPNESRGFFWESEVYAREGKIAEAINSLSRVLEQRPNDVNALYRRAQYYLSQGKSPQGISDLEKLRSTAPDTSELERVLLEARVLLAGEYRNTGRKDLWLQELQALVQDEPESPRATSALVEAYRSEERFAEAERILTAQINRGGARADPGWYWRRSLVARDQGNDGQALADCRRAVELSSYHSWFFAQLLDLYRELGRTAEGIEYYQSHPAGEEPTSTLRASHARLLASAGRQEEAVEQFRQAVARAMQESVQAVRVVYLIIQETFEPAAGVALFNTTLPPGPLARANERILVRVLHLSGQTEEAGRRMAELVRTAATNEERADLLIEQGIMWQDAKRYDLARTSYEEAIKYRPDDWVALNNLAYMLGEDMGKYQLALPYAQSAVAADANKDVLDTLGWIYIGLEKYESAVAELSNATRLEPDNPLLVYHLGEAYRRAGKFIEAKDVLRHGLPLAREAERTDLVEKLQASLTRAEAQDPTP